MKKPEDILDQALLELKKGTPKAEIVSKWPKYKDELTEYLSIAETFSSIAKNPVPRPALQRKYLRLAHKAGFWNIFMNLSNLVAVSAVALLMIAGTAYGAMQSLPGQPLFSLKKTTEQIELHFASNNIDKANLQLTIAKKRLADAQKVFSDPGATPNQQLAALAEVTTQTNQTLQAVKTVAKQDTSAGSPIAASLQDISQQQENLINQIQSTDTTAAPSSSPNSQTRAIAQLREVQAATNEQASLISLNPDPESITATGTVASIAQDIIKVNGVEYGINDNTTFRNSTGTSTLSSDLPQTGSIVLIIATREKSQGKLVAKDILVLQPPVNNTPTGTNAASTIQATTSSSSSVNITKTPAVEDTPEVDNSNQAVGSFIPEDPSPQSPQFNQ